MKLDAGAFSDPEVVKASKEFERIIVNCTKESPATAKRFDVKGFPTVLILGAKGEVLERVCGVRSAAEWRTILSRHSPQRRLQDAPEELKAWIARRVEQLGSDDWEVRERASKELAQLKAALDAALDRAVRSDDPEVRARAGAIRPAPIVVPIKAHQTVKVGAVEVEFGCSGSGGVDYTIRGVKAARVEIVPPEAPKELWIYVE